MKIKNKISVDPEKFKTMPSSEIVKFMQKDRSYAIMDDDNGRYIVKRHLSQY